MRNLQQRKARFPNNNVRHAIIVAINFPSQNSINEKGKFCFVNEFYVSKGQVPFLSKLVLSQRTNVLAPSHSQKPNNERPAIIIVGPVYT